MSAYRGKQGCQDPLCTQDISGKSETCFGWHCTHCHGRSNSMGHCSANCEGSQKAEEDFQQMIADIRSGKIKFEPH